KRLWLQQGHGDNLWPTGGRIMAIQWSMNRIPDFTQVALAAEEAGRARGKQMRTEAALKAFSSNPDEGIALAQTFDPELTEKLSGMNRDRQVRDLTAKAFAPAKPDSLTPGIGDGVQMPSQGGVTINSQALQKLAMLDLDTANKISMFASRANKEQLEQAGEHGKVKAQAAFYLSRFPQGPERDAAFQKMRPRLEQMGFTPDQLAAARLDDQSLKMDQAFGMTVAELANEARVKWVPIGERGLAAFDAQGNPVGSGNPLAGGSVVPDDLAAQAEAAIAAGADPAAVRARMQELGGQGASPATFPGQ
ncbi:MAG: hypothetical protein ACRCS3_04285, partial [Paracoccaceae bacterium]